MEDNKQIEIKDLDTISGGSSRETKEVMSFISEHFPNVKLGDKDSMDRFFKSIGISKVQSGPNIANSYYDLDGHRLTHEDVMKLLQRRADHPKL